MNNLFAQSRSHWVRYDRYEIKIDRTGNAISRRKRRQSLMSITR